MVKASDTVSGECAALDGARRNLSDPVERAQYLLVSYGGVEREKPLRKRDELRDFLGR